MKLYICGNGFDLHHGLKTSYLDYKNYLKNVHPDAIQDFEDIVRVSDDRAVSWSSIEESLGVDYTKMLLKYADLDSTYENFEKYMDSSYSFVENELETAFRGLTNFITNFTGKFLLEWLNSIDTSKVIPDLELTNEDVYLYFNYTDTLEAVYKINKDNILYIHGALDKLRYIDEQVKEIRREQIKMLSEEIGREEANEVWKFVEEPAYYSLFIRNELKFGAVINKEKEMNKLYHQYSGYSELNDFIQPSINVIEEYIDKSTKSLSENYKKLLNFVATKNIDTVIIMGHSLLSVDYPYYKEIILPLLRNKHWVFKSYKGDTKEIEKFVTRAGIESYKVEKW